MGAFYETIPKSLIPWLLQQKLFYIASAPLSATGHVNISPKGGPYFGIIDEKTFWYCDLTGSGIETTSHLHEPGNGRITVMFVAFDGPPRIVRLWGKGDVLEYGTPSYNSFIRAHDVRPIDGTRSIIIVRIHQVGSSCGWSVPTFTFNEHRQTLNDFAKKRWDAERAGNRKDGAERYWAFKNAYSMDGMVGLRRGRETGQKEGVEPIKKMVGSMALSLRGKGDSRGVRTEWVLMVAVLAFVFGVVCSAWWDVVRRRVANLTPMGRL